MATSEPEPMFGEGMGRMFVRGAMIGFVGVFALYTAIAAYAGASFSSTVGLGLFAAFWGGLGYGGMFGAVLGAAEITEAEHRLAKDLSTEQPGVAAGRGRGRTRPRGNADGDPSFPETDRRPSASELVDVGGSGRPIVASTQRADRVGEAVPR